MRCVPTECSVGELAALTIAGRNDAFAECMQRLDLDRRARLRNGPYVDGFVGAGIVVID